MPLSHNHTSFDRHTLKADRSSNDLGHKRVRRLCSFGYVQPSCSFFDRSSYFSDIHSMTSAQTRYILFASRTHSNVFNSFVVSSNEKSANNDTKQNSQQSTLNVSKHLNPNPSSQTTSSSSTSIFH